MDKRFKVNCSPWSNFGDTCVPYMLQKLEIPFIFAHHTVEKKVLMIGSILGVGNRKDSIVWGTGIIDDKTNALPDAHYLAVRGPRTMQKLVEAGVDTTNVAMGDPAMLLPKMYNPTIEKTNKLGVIPHIMDYDLVRNHIINNPEQFPNTIVINPNVPPSGIEGFIDEVLSCEKIVATCLHGVICAHAYGIPAKWMKVSNKLAGDDIKFHDHFESVGITDLEPMDMIENENIEIDDFNSTLDIERLWACRPWLNASEDYYVDIDEEGWENECYPDNYGGKIVDDAWWR